MAEKEGRRGYEAEARIAAFEFVSEVLNDPKTKENPELVKAIAELLKIAIRP